jgi:hypothetical protein
MSKIGEDGKLQLDHQDEVVFRLGLIISAAMNRLSIEQRRPGSGADESDDLVQDLTKRVADLRRIRAEFEEVQSGVVVGGPPELDKPAEFPWHNLLALRDETVKHMGMMVDVIERWTPTEVRAEPAVAAALAFARKARR